MKRFKIIYDSTVEQILTLRNVYQSNDGRPRWRHGESIHFYENCMIGKNFAISRGHCIPGIGHYSYSHSEISDPIEIGNYCSIAEDVSVFGYDHPLESLSTSPFPYQPGRLIFRCNDVYIPAAPKPPRSPPVIEDDVWIGRGAVIRTGIRISTGAVIGASAVVTKDVPPYAIVVGNPGRIIRYRFPESIVRELLNLGWTKFEIKSFVGVDFRLPIEEVISRLRAMQEGGQLIPLSQRVSLMEFLQNPSMAT